MSITSTSQDEATARRGQSLLPIPGRAGQRSPALRRPSARDAHAVAMPAEQTEHLDRLVAGRPEPVWNAGVELGDLAGAPG